MCVPFDAHPPVDAIAGAALDAQRIQLTSKDGTRFDAYAVRAANPTGVGVVVMPDVRGLFPFYEELAMRFAEHGMDSVALDYFARTAGPTPRDADFDYMPHVRQTRLGTVAEDTDAAIEYLRSEAGGGGSRVFTVGFCFGGGRSWLQAAHSPGLTAAIGFYGNPGPTIAGEPGPTARAAEMKAPLLLLQSSIDANIPVEAVREFEAALNQAGVENEVVLYDAPHSFFDRTYAEHRAACDDAWRRILAFITKHSGVAVS